MPELVICGFKTHLEIPIIILFFALTISDSIKTNLLIYRTCYVTLGYDEAECALLGGKNQDNHTRDLEKKVEPYANVIGMSSTFIAALFTAIICFFVGPWSDRFGRKLVMIVSLIGMFFSYVVLTIFAGLPSISPWYSMLSILPLILTGGFSSYMTVALCYIADVTPEKDCGVRMALFEGVLGLGVFLGNISSSYLLTYFGYSYVFLIAAISCLLTAVFTMIFIPESIIRMDPTENSFKSLFQLHNVSEMLQTTFKRRPNYNRAIVLSCVVMITLYIVAITADGAVIFLYLRSKLRWSLEKYTLYSAAHNVSWILGTIIGVYVLHKLLKISESFMILIGFLSMACNALVQGLAVQDWHIYIGAGIRCLGAVISPMIRSLVTKVIPNEDIGKVFSVIVTSESLFGMLGGPLYTELYNATLQSNLSIFNFVTVGIYGVDIILIICVIVMSRIKTEDLYQTTVEEDVNEVSQDGSINS